MELVIVRHAEPEWVRDGLAVDDPGAHHPGRTQAEALAERLGDEVFDALLVSPLQRARETMAPVADALGTEPEVHDWLAEIANPRWAGTPAEAVQRIFRETRVRPVDDHWEGLPGGESFRDFHLRVTRGLDGLLASRGVHRTSEHPPLWDVADPRTRLLVAAHGGTDAVVLGHLLGIPPVPWEWERFLSYHAGLAALAPVPISTGHHFSLERFADTSHLDASLLTR
ncbi:MAG: histidine phosphatase family protein [Acidimicrobiia bacterium]|nr:histidine phosphatase family protein [Acidimicrobiia bacterium]